MAQLRARVADGAKMVAMSTPVARRVAFEYPPDIAPIWTPAKPEFSCAANSVSLMMPTVEPYFVRSIRAALPRLDGPLRQRTEAYLFQEAQHHRQHVLFNRALLGRYVGLARLGHMIGLAYRWVERAGSLQFNVAFAAGSETMAYSAARWAARHRRQLFTGADEVASTLFLWHLAEEVEHKSVAHDVYRHLFGGGWRAQLLRMAATAVALALMVIFVVTGTAVMVTAEGRLHRPVAWLRLIGWSVTFAFELLSNLVLSMLPGHHPGDFVDPLWYEIWLKEFDAETATVPVWHRSGAERQAHPLEPSPLEPT
ncbi:MAG: metal-dependent hydrolase [Acidimicrobiales bacterium]